METIKILVFEDDIQSIKGAFDFAKELEFNGNLSIRFAPKSQDVNMSDLGNYDVIFVDITLAAKTQMDGYAILKKIKEEHLVEPFKVRVMTGNSRVEEMMENNGIPESFFKVVHKPIDFQMITNSIREVIAQSENQTSTN